MMKYGKEAMVTSIILLVLSMTVWAANKKSTTINLAEPATVGSTQLAPGEYTLTWNDSESGVNVTFMKGRTPVVTVPAQLTEGRSPYRGPAITTEGAANTIKQIQLPNLSLAFGDGQEAGAGR